MTIDCHEQIDIVSPTISEDTTKDKLNKTIKDSNQTNGQKQLIIKSSEISSDPSALSNCIRCNKCQKKLRLALQFRCKCSAFFCSSHKYADTHECTFDFKKQWRIELSNKNPKINGKKIEKI